MNAQMEKFESVLAATDFSTDSQHAAARAAMLCAGTELARGMILHVVEASWLDNLKRFVNLPTDIDRSVTGSAETELARLAGKVRKHSGVTLETEVRVGRVLETIREAAEDYSLMVLGARGNHRLREFALGTTAERLLRQIDTPILIVRRRPVEHYKRVLVAVDFSPHAARAVAQARALAPNADVHLVHVFEGLFEGRMRYAGVTEELIEEYRRKARDEAEAQMKTFAESVGAGAEPFQTCIEHGAHVPTKLLDKARDMAADLVVVGKHGKSLTEKLLLGSVTLHMVGQSSCDVLVAQ